LTRLQATMTPGRKKKIADAKVGRQATSRKDADQLTKHHDPEKAPQRSNAAVTHGLDERTGWRIGTGSVLN
jgi:hypothetical protein